MGERRIDVTESQIRKLLETTYKEAWHDGGGQPSTAGIDWAHDWKHSKSAEYVEKLIALEDEQFSSPIGESEIENAYKEGWWDGKQHGKDCFIQIEEEAREEEAREHDWKYSSAAMDIINRKQERTT